MLAAVAHQTKKPFAGVDLTRAAKELRGVVARALDVDWLGLDPAGNVAVFLGDDASPVPPGTDAEVTSAALEAVARAVAQRTAAAAVEDAYRAAAARAQEPVFDAPLAAPGVALHDKPFDGYPHLVVASPHGAEVVRRVMNELGGREVLARHDFAAAIDVVGHVSYEELHEGGACAGCRVLDDPNDPRPRAPEALAAAGLYVYAFATTPSGDAWIRVASPSVPADRGDLQEMAHLSASFVEVAFGFEETTWTWAR